MRDFWETHHWPAGERRAHWHLLFEDQPAVHDFARAHTEVLHRYPELNPVPVQWLHATVQSIGPLTPAAAAAVAAAARPALAAIEPFAIEIGPAQAIHNGVVPAIYPENRITDLYWTLRRVTEHVVGTQTMPKAPEVFWPHLSLAYSGARWDHDELSRALVRLRPPRPRMTVTRAVLVDQKQTWRDKYTWTVIAEVPLGRPTPAP
ncbi:2'-5' RNA ligase family protein (plasmid) [Streptomyces sp. AM 4-1-1]|uniref:2'-5' RNA ligase family protein n=1 Tax=Streptomyces sp. AM 4-1-1 TaxID=3028710 RepID=UPI0023B9584C|nr:2'-5' RNA ligase family protein [Streptomyces sp. AM 4-1-1]WEH37849.1 2'-5' RNA ligase family protein [Streptomyces sp. AM 4-1-1]